MSNSRYLEKNSNLFFRNQKNAKNLLSKNREQV